MSPQSNSRAVVAMQPGDVAHPQGFPSSRLPLAHEIIGRILPPVLAMLSVVLLWWVLYLIFPRLVTRLLVSGKYRVLVDFDVELQRIFGAPPLKGGIAVLKETFDKQPELVKAIRAAYVDGIKVIKSGEDKDFFESHAKELFGLSTPEEIAAGMKRNRENFADIWGEKFFESQNKILQKGIALGLLPDVGNLNDLWIK